LDARQRVDQFAGDPVLGHPATWSRNRAGTDESVVRSEWDSDGDDAFGALFAVQGVPLFTHRLQFGEQGVLVDDCSVRFISSSVRTIFER
jgi:hypothetical protein